MAFNVSLAILVSEAYPALRFNGRGDERIGSDDRIVSDDSLSSEYRSSCVNGNSVFDGGMALLAPEALASPCGKSSDGNALIDLHIITDDGGLAYNDAGSVIYEEVAPG